MLLTLAATGCGALEGVTESPDAAVLRSTTPSSDSVQSQVVFRRILCFGDSLTAGVTLQVPPGEGLLAPVEGYVPKLGTLLRREFGEGIELIDSGVPGETTSEGVRRLSNETLLYRPDLVLLLEGVVDVNNADPQTGEARANLRRMIEIVQGREAAVIIATVPPLNPEGFRANAPGAVRDLNEIIRGIAVRDGTPLADVERAFGDDLSLQGPDGLHPNDSGYRVIAETWFQAIRALSAQRP